MMHLEALSDNTKQLWPFLKKFPDFYLAGGTALALQIGHRVSVDFDLFSEKKIESELLDKVNSVFAKYKTNVLVNNSGELTVNINDVKTTFLHYPFPIVNNLEKEEGLALLGVEEIGATKAYTIGRRGTFKDYIDLYYILLENLSSLEAIINLSQKKYGDDFNTRLFLEQLIYLDDVEDANIMFLKEPVDKSVVKDFFANRIKQLSI